MVQGNDCEERGGIRPDINPAALAPSLVQESSQGRRKRAAGYESAARFLARFLPHRRRLRFPFFGRRAEISAAPSHSVAEFFALFRTHVLPTLMHAAAEVRTTTSVPAPSVVAEENTAQRQQSNRLPESNEPPPEKARQQPVPEPHHNFTANEDEQYHRCDRRRRHPKPSLSHIRFLIFPDSVRFPIPDKCFAAAPADALPHNACAKEACSCSRPFRSPVP